jgi:molybdopterin-binding protein
LVGKRLLYLTFYDLPIGRKILLSIRASDVILSKIAPSGISARNVVMATISSVYNSDRSVLVECDCGVKMLVEITHQALGELGFTQGSEIYMIIKASAITLLDQ